MIKLSSQELEICYILSKVFDFGTDYKALLQKEYELVQICKEVIEDTRHTEDFKKHYQDVLTRTEGKEKESALERVREKYIEIKNEILLIKPDFSKDDLGRLFPFTAWICWSKPSAISYWGIGEYDGWNRKEFFKEALTLQKPIRLLMYKIFKGILMQIVKNHYINICFIFNFLSQKQQTIYLQKDFCIHYWAIYINIIGPLFGFLLIFLLFIYL